MKKIKNILALLMAAAMLLALAACGSGSGSGSGASASAGSTDKEYDLSFSMHTPSESTYGQIFQAFFDEVAEKTDGHVKITNYGSGTLAAAKDVADMVKDGGCDIGWLFTSFYYGQYPMTDVITVPLQNAQTSEQGTEVLWDLYETYPEMASEWDDYVILQMYANPVSYIYSTEKIESPADLAGKSIRSTSGGVADVMAMWGANVITMAPNDIYDSLQKNNIQGYTAEPTMIVDYSLQEVTPYCVKVPLYQAAFVMVMNKDTFNSLPEEYQEVLASYSTREASVDFARQIDAYVEECDEQFAAAGGEIIDLTDAQLAEFRTAAEQYAETWAESNSTADFDAGEYYDFCFNSYANHAPAAN